MSVNPSEVDEQIKQLMEEFEEKYKSQSQINDKFISVFTQKGFDLINSLSGYEQKSKLENMYPFLDFVTLFLFKFVEGKYFEVLEDHSKIKPLLVSLPPMVKTIGGKMTEFTNYKSVKTKEEQINVTRIHQNINKMKELQSIIDDFDKLLNKPTIHQPKLIIKHSSMDDEY